MEELQLKAKKLNHSRQWMRSAPVKKLLDSVEYLKDKHDAKVSQYVDHYYTAISMTLKNLSGLKDEGLAALLDAFVHSNPDSTYSWDDAGSFARLYSFTWYGPDYDGYRPQLMVAVTANFKEDSETCRRVITGYTEPDKTPRPIYELRCDEDKAEESGE